TAVMSHHYFQPGRKITQGIQDVSNENAGGIEESNKASKSPEIVARAKKKMAGLRQAGAPFALWVHLFEPHASYMVHPGGPQFGTSLSDKYDGEVAFVDRYLGDLLDELKAEGLDKNTAVIVFSDHGEAFGEHHLYFHGQSLYN